MGDGQLADGELDAILALQFLVAWAGEGLCQPKRLDWWRTDLIDEDGGGYFFQALFPKTHPWAAFEAVRKAAIQHDRQTRLNMAYPDSIRTLFFWGFHLDEQLDDRLAQHKRNEHQVPPEDALSLPMNLHDTFAKTDFEIAIQSSHRPVQYKVVPEGREIVEAIPDSKELYARNLAATLLPLADHYPMPFYRLEGLCMSTGLTYNPSYRKRLSTLRAIEPSGGLLQVDKLTIRSSMGCNFITTGKLLQITSS